MKKLKLFAAVIVSILTLTAPASVLATENTSTEQSASGYEVKDTSLTCYVNSEKGLNVRSGPSTDYSVIGTLSIGSTLVYLSLAIVVVVMLILVSVRGFFKKSPSEYEEDYEDEYPDGYDKDEYPEEDEGNYSGEDEEYYEDEYSEEDFENEGESEYINENDDMYREEDYDDDDL